MLFRDEKREKFYKKRNNDERYNTCYSILGILSSYAFFTSSGTSNPENISTIIGANTSFKKLGLCTQATTCILSH